MKILLFLFICFFCLGCLSFPFILGSGGITNLTEEGVVNCSINVGIEKLWQAAILEFRKTDIIEANKKEFYIKAIDKDLIVEFKAEPKDNIHSLFRIKVSNLQGRHFSEVAQKFSERVYKRARSLWFSLNQFLSSD